MRAAYFGFLSFLLVFILQARQMTVLVPAYGMPDIEGQASPSSPGPTGEEYVIWSLAIADVLEHSKPPATILLDNETDVARDVLDLQKLLDDHSKESVPTKHGDEWRALQSELRPDTVTSFKQRNQGTDLLSNRFSVSVPIVLITHQELTALSDKSPGHFWEVLRQRHPKAIGIFRISRIGFNSTRTQAIVYIEYRSGEEGGDGRYVLVHKKNGVWICVRRAVAWMS